MAINPISTYSQAKQIQQNPIGFGLNEAYNSNVAKTTNYSPTGKTNIANSMRGYLSTGDFVGAVIGFATNVLSVTGEKKNSDGSITKTTYATPFSMAEAVANPSGFLATTLYGSEMARSNSRTATGKTNIANSALGGLVFGPIGALFGGLANFVGGLFGGNKNSTSSTKVSSSNTFGSSTYSGFGSDAYGRSNNLGATLGTVSKNNGVNIAGYSGYGSVGYTGFGSDAYATNLSSSNGKNSASNNSTSNKTNSGSYSSYSSGNISLHDLMGQVASNRGTTIGSGSSGHNGGGSSSSSSGGSTVGGNSGYGSYGNPGGGRGTGGTQMGAR